MSPANKDGLGGIEHDEAKDLTGFQRSDWDWTLARVHGHRAHVREARA